MTLTPQCQSCAFKAAKMDLIVAGLQAAFNMTMGFLCGSIALHAFSLQFFGDLFSKSINLFGIQTAAKLPSDSFPYGYGKVQFLSGLFIGILLVGGSVAMMVNNIIHLHEGMTESPSALAIASILLTGSACELMHRYMICVGRNNNNIAITAAAWDNRNDALASGVVMVGIISSRFGVHWADHMAALVVSLLVARSGITIVTNSVRGLLDFMAPEHILRQVERVVESTPGISRTLDIRGRQLGEHWEFDLHLVVDGGQSLHDVHKLEIDLTHRLYREIFHLGHVHIHFIPQPSDPETPSRKE